MPTACAPPTDRACAPTFCRPLIRLMQKVSSSLDSGSARSQCLGGCSQPKQQQQQGAGEVEGVVGRQEVRGGSRWQLRSGQSAGRLRRLRCPSWIIHKLASPHANAAAHGSKQLPRPRGNRHHLQVAPAVLAPQNADLLLDAPRDVHLRADAVHAHVGRVGRDGHTAEAAEPAGRSGRAGGRAAACIGSACGAAALRAIHPSHSGYALVRCWGPTKAKLTRGPASAAA